MTGGLDSLGTVSVSFPVEKVGQGTDGDAGKLKPVSGGAEKVKVGQEEGDGNSGCETGEKVKLKVGNDGKLLGAVGVIG